MREPTKREGAKDVDHSAGERDDSAPAPGKSTQTSGMLGGAHDPSAPTPAPSAPSAGTSAGDPTLATTLAPTITSQTQFGAPVGGKSRQVVGVGETVKFTGSASGAWSATGGRWSPTDDTSFSWHAPGTPGQFTIKLKVGDKTATRDIAVIAPSTIKFERVQHFNPPAGVMGAGMRLKMTLGPNNVSFSGATFKEHPSGAVASGYFSRVKGGLNHEPDAGDTSIAPETNHATTLDTAYISDAGGKWPKRKPIPGRPAAGPYDVGSMTWQIPHSYSAGGVTQMFTIVTQTMSIVDTWGSTTITKGGASVMRPGKAPEVKVDTKESKDFDPDEPDDPDTQHLKPTAQTKQ